MMRKTLTVVFVAFVAIQFIRPAKPSVEQHNTNLDLFAHRQPPEHVRQIITSACYDCHSNQTHYPWYAQIQPAAWFLQKHIDDGKRALNFSEFGKLSRKRVRKKLESCIDAVSEHQMPLKSYTIIHHDARLTEGQIKDFVAWAEEEIRRSESAVAED